MCHLAGNLNLTVITPPDDVALLAAPGGVEASGVSGNLRMDADDLAFAQRLADAADLISLELCQGAELLLAATPDGAEASEADRAVQLGCRGCPTISWTRWLPSLEPVVGCTSHALYHQVLVTMLGRHLIAGCDHDFVELTPLRLQVLAGVGLQGVHQQATARRGRVPIDPKGRVRWAG